MKKAPRTEQTTIAAIAPVARPLSCDPESELESGEEDGLIVEEEEESVDLSCLERKSLS